MLALLEFQKHVEALRKNALNPHFKKQYADINAILTEVKPKLTELGLVLLQPIRAGRIYTEIWAGKDLLISADMELPQGLAPQQLGSAITYYRRYLLVSMLALETEDDDANTAQPLPAKAPQQSAKPATVSKPLPPLTPEIVKAMQEAISAGRIVEVNKRLLNYTVTEAERNQIFNLK